MKKIIWGLCLLGTSAPGYAAFFQQTEDEAAAEVESPVKVTVQGADTSLADNLKAFMPSLRNLKCDSSNDRVADFIESAEEKLPEGAEAMGYYNARFNVTAVKQGNCLALHVAVQPGEPVRVTDVKVQVTGAGKDLPEFRSITAVLPYQRGDVLVHQRYEDFKASLNSTANRLGFFDAEYLIREIQVDPETRQAKVRLHFDTGKRYQVGKVTVEQDVLAEKYLNRYLRVREGDTYNTENLLKQQRILDGSGYYEEVQVSGAYQQAENGVVPVAINAQRRKRYTYSGRLGYGTDTGFRVETDMEAHWVNNKGHKLNAKGTLAQNEQSVEGSYKVPLWEPEHEYASLSGGVRYTDNNGIESEAFKVGVDYNRRNDNDWQQTVFVNYLDETTRLNSGDETRSQLTIGGVRVKKTKTDDLLFPTQGWQVAAEVQGAAEGVLSDQSVLQGKFNGKYLHTLERGGKLILQGTAGSTLTNELDEMPKSLRFFAGGQSSVRGYDFESLGETNTAGDVVGGKHLLTTSVEYEHPVVDNWSAAAFVDAGNAFDNTAHLTMNVGVGFGVRYKSPLGPIRADIAAPKDDPSDVHFYFSLGPDL
ncbi:autotransporter secretion outer membrane protein TamA [Thiothrix caldifontis]|uniref:Translocation and assembly module subunit TamA n=1 Tax=Thiothrix caldifontis TaxID=525918 RepID=A0A1H3VN50_9GAMM|nr:autotransporter assembly complex family protein [Thiothrix caldifontis]SDZ76215.1 autotransporter secretion outer membrane protein TamA [Thiothrix caldifontis]